MTVAYLCSQIVEFKRTKIPAYGMTVDGYSKKEGAPTSYLIRLEGEKIWRRVYVWQFSNAGTPFVRIKGKPYILHEYQIPEPNSDAIAD